MMKAVAYYRVSTEQQGKSGLGLDAQKKSVNDFATVNSFDIIFEFTEVESGRKSKRPQLVQALEICKKEKATLIIAKLDRLGRNVAFIANLMESKVNFKAVDIPLADPLILHIMAAFAQHERSMISKRTKEALQAAKRRGTKLGQYGKNILSKHNKKAANDFAKKVKPQIVAIKKDGYQTIQEITDELNKRKVPTYYGQQNKWHLPTVHKILKRTNLQSKF